MTLTVAALTIVLITTVGWVSATPVGPIIFFASFIGLLAAMFAFIFGSDA